jgi:hypothetical protein
MSEVSVAQVVGYTLAACQRAGKTEVEWGKTAGSVRRVFLIKDKKEIVRLFRACKTTNTKICEVLSEATNESYWTWATRISNWIMADNKGNLNVDGAVAVQRSAPKQEAKQMTIDVAHRLVAFDCDIGCLQAQLENFKESYQQELDRQQLVIDNRIHEMNQLKAEYNVA